jgi:ribosomal protein S18 acetylase RimI-like enzyme
VETLLINSKLAKLGIAKAGKGQEHLIKLIYKESRKELGSFNLYQCWEKYLSGQSREHFWVYKNCGFVRWVESKKYGGNYIHDIGILKEHRGKSIGKKLLQSIPLPIVLKCNEDNVSGNNFYKAIGMYQSGIAFTRKGVKQIIWSCAAW